MRTLLVGLMAIALAPIPAIPSHAQSAGAKFDQFYASFKAAVAHRDKRRLQRMMASNFEFFRAADVAPTDVFRALDQNNQQQWRNLQLAIQQGAPVAQNYRDHSARLLWCTPSQVIYNCYVVFQKDSFGCWKWKGFVMPQK
jgi:hypothetical protein